MFQLTEREKEIMNAFEKVLLGLISAAPAVTPIFVHSSQGLLIMNASEVLLASILSQFNKTPVAASVTASNQSTT